MLLPGNHLLCSQLCMQHRFREDTTNSVQPFIPDPVDDLLHINVCGIVELLRLAIYGPRFTLKFNKVVCDSKPSILPVLL